MTGTQFVQNLTGLPPQLTASGAVIVVGLSNFAQYNGIAVGGPSSFGTGGLFIPQSSTGSSLGLDGALRRLYITQGYVSNTDISGTSTWTNATIASLGLTPGTYSYSLPNDTLTIVVSAPAPAAQAVPTLSEWSQMLLALLVMTMIGWYFHKQRSY